MRRRIRTGRLQSIGLAVAVACGVLGVPTATFGQEPGADSPPVACTAEVEPNELPEQAPSLTGEICQTGTLPAQIPADQDLILWEVLPEDGLTTWSFTVRGVPTTITSIHVIPITSPPGVLPLEIASEVLRVDSDALLDTPPGVAESRIAPGRYVLGISRGLPFQHDLTDDVGYEVSIVRTGELPPTGDVEPNDDPTTATAVSGAFTLSGDLQATNDQYRWTITPEAAVTPVRLDAQTAVGAPLGLELADASGVVIGSASASPAGVATLHDVGLQAGEYIIRLSPGAAQTQPYTLTAASVADSDVDPEPNDTPERALALDPATLTASGRLATDLDVDAYLFDIDEALAANLVDIGMSWSDGLDRSLCLSTETGTRIGCLQGDPNVAFAGLLLPAGRYRLDVSGTGSLDDRYRIAVTAGAPLPPTGDVEPNDDAATASPVTGAFAVSGDLSTSVPGTGDVFAWTVSEADAARSWRLELSATPGIGGQLGLYGPDGSGLASAQTSPEGTARIFDLRLPAGTYTAWITQSGSASPGYVLRSVEETAPDIDPEPNDVTVRAVPLDPETRAARGRIATATDVDRYSFVVDEALAADLVDLHVAWPSDREYQLCLNNEYGSQMQCRSGRDGLSLGDLRLAPARYELQVSGQADPETRYDVSVTSGLAPALDHEVEPNDLATAPTDWDPSLVMRGRSEDGDVDTYRIHVEGVPEVWRLDAAGTGLGSPLWTQPDGTRVGVAAVVDDGSAAVIEDLYLVAGDHLLTVGADGEYSLALTSLGPPDLAAEREPNDDPDHAAPIEVGGERTARLPVSEDVDVYRFSLAAPEHVIVTVTPPADGSIDLEVTSARTSLAQVAASAAGQPVVFDGMLPGSDFEIWLRPGAPSTGAYSIRLDRGDPFTSGADGGAPGLDATLELTPDRSEVAAFWRDGQRVEATLRLANSGSNDLTLSLDAATTHHAWSVELPAEVEVASGGTLDVPLTIRVPADAWLGIPVRVTVRARDPAGAQGTAFTDITPGRDVSPVAPQQAWSVPAELLGGLDVASAALGAVPIGSHFHEVDIHDGVSIAELGLSDSIQNGPLTLGVDLAGDELIPVAGTILDPLAGDNPFAFRPRAFTLLLSEDGVTYEEVLSAELGPQTEHQAFTLDAPVPARFAQLRIDSTWGDARASVFLGEWKVVADPGFAPATAGLNIADPVRGGHVVWNEPASQDVSYYLLPETDTDPRTVALEAGRSATWVIGFADDRAAQINRLEWDDLVGSVPEYQFSSANVAVSVGSPLGPWQDVGEWQLQRADDGTVADLELPEPVWARFVRLTLPGPAEASAYRELPRAVRVIERPTDETYRSILGEWGQSSPQGIYELLVPSRSIAAGSEDPDVGDTPEEAATLVPDESAAGSVSRSRDEDWYALTVPDAQDTLRIALRTERDGDVRLRLQDAEGVDIALAPGRTEDASVTTWTAIVEPGADYWLEVVQPVLSVVIEFDTSASIAKWAPQLRAAVRAFAEDVTPGQEVVQLFPFEEPDLLENWGDQPYLIAGAMDGWPPPPGGSSALEASILRAAAMLAERDGMRAILVIGDAVSGGFQGGIPAATLASSRPAIFPVHLGGGADPYVSTHIMQDLAATNGGFYQYHTSQAAIERAFERMATWLRRPAGYELSYETSFVDYPPSALSVIPAEGATVPIGGSISVELVLDTSGSMNKRIAGVTRMAIAREVLTRLVDETLPEGLPVALRTFKAGDGSCKTVLPVPFGPLDRAAMDRVIAELPLHRKTRTPLGATLHAVGDDLAAHEGPKIVVFVTDGKETCKGDPAAEVERLVDLGVEVTMNIVGFALDDPALKADMEAWASAGGGVFFDAQDQESLLAGVAATLRAPYRVFDRDGALVASGVVGGSPLELPTGIYRVEVLSTPPATFEAVTLAPGETVSLEVEPDGS